MNSPHIVEKSNKDRIDSKIDIEGLPNHIAIVMDGNGRWATSQGLSRTKGHEQGEQALYDVIYGARDLGINYITVYAFSTENWSRPKAEVAYLMGFNERLLVERLGELHDHNIRVIFVGRREKRIPSRLIKRMDEAQAKTKDNTGMTLCIAFNYGSRAEVVDATKKIVQKVIDGELSIEKIDENILSDNFYFPNMPDVDFVLRTSGEKRISNFLLFQGAYAELIFTDTLWPDMRRENLFEAIIEFQNRTRRFGSV
ncbi:MAG: polyprenyl diphosphate synthase [Acidimicrobiia bacterium]